MYPKNFKIFKGDWKKKNKKKSYDKNIDLPQNYQATLQQFVSRHFSLLKAKLFWHT